MRHSTTSFLVSLCVHLLLLSLVSGVWFAGERSVGIRLSSGHETASQIEDHLVVNIELPMDESVLKTEIEPLDELVIKEAVNVSFDEMSVLPDTLDPFSMITIEEVDGISRNSRGSGGRSAFGSSSGSSFFGLPTKGDRIVYLVDMSPSMGVGKYQTRYARAVNEVLESVKQLQSHQKFFVILFSFRTIEIRIDGSEPFCHATDENRALLEQKLKSINLLPGTDPREALVRALEENPSCIFLLSDGEFNGERHRSGPFGRKETFAVVKMYNRHHCPINTIGLEDRSNQDILTRIASASGGEYAFIPADD